MQRLLAAVTLVLGFGFAGAQANPVFYLGGQPVGGGSGLAWGFDSGSGVGADHANGQTFITWPHPLSVSVVDYTKRARVYESSAPITSANYTAATLIANYDLPNGGQLFGGNPDTGGASFTQANRQSASQPMSIIPDAHLGGTKTLTYGTDLQVRTVPSNRSAYYAVVLTDTSDASPTFLGSVGPIAETAATPQAILYAHRTAGCGRITSSVAGFPVVFQAHASSSAGGAATNSTVGDYYEWFGDTTQGWQDGPATAFDVYRDGFGGCQSFPSLSGGALVYGNRDTIWDPLGTGAMETDHFGLGLTPNPLVGVANRHYPTTFNKIQKQLTWLIGNYGADANQVHMTGSSMGAIAGAITGTHMTSPQFASVWMMHPLFRLDQWCPSGGCWPGITWTSGMPFKATVGAAPNTLGSTASAVLRADGSSWFNFIDAATFWAASPGSDLPFFGITDAYGDVNLSSSGAGSWSQILTGINALQTAHRGHAAVFYNGAHWTQSGANGAIDCDANTGTDAIAGVCYSKSLFKLNAPYPAIDHSSIDDNPGTATRDSNGIYDGDRVGCINCGFTWSVTSDTAGGLSFTVGNGWMTRSPTTLPSSTLASAIAASGTTSFTIASSTGFLPTASVNKNAAFLVGTGTSTEILYADLNSATNTLTVNTRGAEGSTGKVHSIGDPIVQLVSKPTGPNGGPYPSMTANVTWRRLANFKPANGATLTCTITPFGDSTVTQNPVVANGLFTLIAVPINSGGNTSVACA